VIQHVSSEGGNKQFFGGGEEAPPTGSKGACASCHDGDEGLRGEW
jgi:hypothetical protein